MPRTPDTIVGSRTEEITTRILATLSVRYAPAWAAIVLCALLITPFAVGRDSYALHLLMTMFLFATLGHAWNLMAGYAGLLTFGQQVFIGIGGFAEAIVFYYAPVPIWLAWPVSGLAAVAFAWLLCLPIRARGSRRRVWIGLTVAVLAALGYEAVVAAYPYTDIFGSTYVRRIVILLLIFLGALPILKMRGAYFAIATWLIAESVSTIINGWDVVGAGGGMQIKTSVTQLQLYYAALALLAATTVTIFLWIHSTSGLALTAIRDDEEAAQSCGIDVGAVKAIVFLFSALVTGLTGGLYFIDVVVITPPSAFAISWASYIVFIAVSGGMGTIVGPLIGALFFVAVERLLGAAAGQGLLLLGLISIVLMLVLPRGVMGLVSDLLYRRSQSSAGSDPTSTHPFEPAASQLPPLVIERSAEVKL